MHFKSCINGYERARNGISGTFRFDGRRAGVCYKVLKLMSVTWLLSLKVMDTSAVWPRTPDSPAGTVQNTHTWYVLPEDPRSSVSLARYV